MPHFVPATWRNLAAANIRADLPSRNAPAARVLLRTSLCSSSSGLSNRDAAAVAPARSENREGYAEASAPPGSLHRTVRRPPGFRRLVSEHSLPSVMSWCPAPPYSVENIPGLSRSTFRSKPKKRSASDRNGDRHRLESAAHDQTSHPCKDWTPTERPIARPHLCGQCLGTRNFSRFASQRESGWLSPGWKSTKRKWVGSTRKGLARIRVPIRDVKMVFR